MLVTVHKCIGYENEDTVCIVNDFHWRQFFKTVCFLHWFKHSVHLTVIGGIRANHGWMSHLFRVSLVTWVEHCHFYFQAHFKLWTRIILSHSKRKAVGLSKDCLARLISMQNSHQKLSSGKFDSTTLVVSILSLPVNRFKFRSKTIHRPASSSVWLCRMKFSTQSLVHVLF